MTERYGVAGFTSVDLAMNQVLAAEREARKAVNNCREDAGRILDQAEERAQRIRRTTERRIQAAHHIADAAVDKTLRTLRETGLEDTGGRAGPMDQERLGRALDLLVDEIVGELP
jgi:vacuolar-type H+-ATPase subunit H